jgi:hypothetical protein
VKSQVLALQTEEVFTGEVELKSSPEDEVLDESQKRVSMLCLREMILMLM